MAGSGRAGPVRGSPGLVRHHLRPRQRHHPGQADHRLDAGRRGRARLRRRRPAGRLLHQRGPDPRAGEGRPALLEPALPQRGRGQVPRRDRASGGPGRGLLDGRLGGRLRQRRPDGPLRDGREPQHPVPQPGRRDLRGRHRTRRGLRRFRRPQALVGRGGLAGLRPGRRPRPLRGQLPRLVAPQQQALRRRGPAAVVLAHRVRGAAEPPLPQRRRRAGSPTSPAPRGSGPTSGRA